MYIGARKLAFVVESDPWLTVGAVRPLMDAK
jgi:hypothetical protein